MKQLLLVNPELESRKVAVFGTGRAALRLFSVLLQNDIYVECFVSRQMHPAKLKIMNKPIISVYDLNTWQENKGQVLVFADPSDEAQAKKLEQDGFAVFYDQNLASYDGDCIFL